MTWPIHRLADHCHLITKGTTPTSIGFDFADKGVPFLRVGNISGGAVNFESDTLFVSAKVHDALKRSKIAPRDVLLSIAGSIGRAGVVPTNAPEMNCNQALAIIRAKDSICRPYLRHWLESQQAQAQIKGVTVTGTIQNLSLAQVGDLKVPLPDLEEQQRIAAILDQADALRAQRREAMAQLDSLTQAIFIEMFGDPVSNPKALPVVPTGELADVQGGLQVTSARKDLPIEAPYLRVGNVYRGYMDLSEIKLIRATASEIERTLLRENDLLVVEGHGNPNEIGRSALWRGQVSGCVHQNHLIRVRFNLDRIDPAYACEYLNSPGGRRHLLRAGKTTTGLNTISVSNVRAAPLALPPLALQRSFATRIQSVEALKATHRAALAELDELFASLQHRAFTGAL